MSKSEMGNLVLERRVGEAIRIGDSVVMTVSKITPTIVRLAFTCPREIKILRTEIDRQPLDSEQYNYRPRQSGGAADG